MGNRLPIDRDALRVWMRDYILSVLDLPPEQVPTAQTFDTYGFDSVEAVVMAGVMEEEFGVPVDPVQLLEHPSIDEFADAHGADEQATADNSGMPNPDELDGMTADPP
jgi:acyl carrier protein